MPRPLQRLRVIRRAVRFSDKGRCQDPREGLLASASGTASEPGSSRAAVQQATTGLTGHVTRPGRQSPLDIAISTLRLGGAFARSANRSAAKRQAYEYTTTAAEKAEQAGPSSPEQTPSTGQARNAGEPDNSGWWAPQNGIGAPLSPAEHTNAPVEPCGAGADLTRRTIPPNRLGGFSYQLYALSGWRWTTLPGHRTLAWVDRTSTTTRFRIRQTAEGRGLQFTESARDPAATSAPA